MLKIHSIPQVAEILGGKSASTIWRMIRSTPAFPRPVRFGENSVGIRSDELEAYIRALPVSQAQPHVTNTRKKKDEAIS